jgi:hypothetical protein
MLKIWKRKQAVAEPRDDEDLLLYMPRYYPADNTLEAHLRCIDLAFSQAVENHAKARRKRIKVVK